MEPFSDSLDPQASADTPPAILVADDDRDVLHVNTLMLSRSEAKYRIISAPNGEVACRLAEQKQPDLILLDWQMPVMSGVDALRKLKSQPVTKHIPVIMVTGLTDSERLEEAFQAGAADFVNKPVDQLELLARVRNTLALNASLVRVKTQARALVRQQEALMDQSEQLSELNEALTRERDETTRLLHNILPGAAAEEMIETGHYEPRYYDKVTVMFTDLEGFTKQAASMSPQELVQELECCFNAFDEIIGKHNLEKIKTIGDGYMCAGGVPTPNASNPCDAVAAALEMQAFMSRWRESNRLKNRQEWSLRVGLHTGPVVAGIIGKNRFAYDVWGDAVNLAARMEQHGIGGRINISGDTYEHVKDRYDCSFRGKLPARNRGEVDMYLVERAAF